MAAHAIRAPLVRLRVGRLDDARLAELAAEGDEHAFEVVYDRHHRALLAFCRHMLGSQDEGEDALQQTFLRAHRSLLAQGAPDELRPWLFAIARNRCLTMLAARKAAALPVEDVEPSTDGLSAGVERRAELRELLGDIARLPEDQRSALVLAEVGDLTHAEIARVIEVPTAKVKALVHQARTRLIADRDARETPCEEIREQLATASGGELRRGPLRRHLALCDGCRAYKDAVAEQRGALALVLPVLPSVGLKDTIFGALGGGGGAAAAAGGTAAGGAGAAFSGGGATAGIAAKSLGAKLAIGAALAGGAGGGVVAVERAAHSPERPAAASATGQDAAAGTPAVASASLPGSQRSPVADGILDGSPSEGRGSATGQARRAAAAERRRERAAKRRAAQRRRLEARRQAKRDRAARKDTRVAAREQGKRERAVAKQERTTAREQRLAARPDRGTQRSPTAVPQNQKIKPVATPKPLPAPKPVATPRATATPQPVPTPSLTPIAGGNAGKAKGREIEEVAP